MAKSSWQLNRTKKYPKISGSVEVDAAIVGGGLAGVTAAYLLSKEGISCALLEKGKLLESTTLYTTAHVSYVIDTRITDLVSMFGAKRARLIWESGQTAIDKIESIVKRERVECDFMRVSAIVYAREQDQTKDIVEDWQTAKKLGFKVRLRKAREFRFENEGAMEVKGQAKFHPLKYAHALAARAQKNGAHIFERSEVTKIKKDKNIFRLKTKNGEVHAKKILVTTYQPFNNPKEVKLKKGMYKSYVIEANLNNSKIQEGIYWDYSNPYYYFRVDTIGRKKRIIFGGEDHRKEIPMGKKNFISLKKELIRLFGAQNINVTKKWMGPILEPIDGLALIGEYDPGAFIATAFSGNGMTYSTLAAVMFRDYVMGSRSRYTALYDPTRIPSAKQLAKKGIDYVEEFVGGAAKNVFK